MRGLIGEMRSAHARGDKRELARLVLGVRGGEQFEDVLRYARGLDADVLSPDRLVSWAVVTNECNCTDRYKGVLTVCGVEIDVPDMEAVTHRWSTRPGWYVLDVWERDEWVRSDAGASHRDAPRRCLETIDAHLRGEAHVEAVMQARNAAADAACFADAANADDAATYAAGAAHAAHAAAHAAAASAAYTDAAYTDAAAAAAAEERKMWHEDWRWHLLWHALREVS